MGGKILGKEFSTHLLYRIKEDTIMALSLDSKIRDIMRSPERKQVL